MNKIVVAGIGTDVGKTVAAAILVEALQTDYWKPIQCGRPTDSDQIKQLIQNKSTIIHPESYLFKKPASPHDASRAEGCLIDIATITPPKTERTLIIEGCGGLMVPLNENYVWSDLAKGWNAKWILVSRNYLGSINHTLLSLNYLCQHHIPVLGIIFNGEPNPASEEIILKQGKINCLGRILPEVINPEMVKRYAAQFRNTLAC